MKSSIRAALAVGALALAASQASASTVNLASGGTYTAFDTPIPASVTINVGAGVTGAKFLLEDTINDGFTVLYQLYASDHTTTVGSSFTFTDLGDTAVNLAQTAVYRALNPGQQYFLDMIFTNATATAFGITTNISAVPLPAAAWLFGSALLGLGALRRKQKAGDNSEMAAA